jgi:glycerophosphoryl diester phosphodiesterase
MQHIRNWAYAAIATVLGSGCSSIPSQTAICPVSPFQHSKPWVIAHASSDYFGPGNTIEMMRAAVDAGADVVDADIRVTSDGVLVASHDDSIRLATNETISISHTSLSDLQSVDLGSTWAGPNGDYPLKDKSVQIPTIDAVIQAFPGRTISLEFKVTGGEQTLCTTLRSLKRTKDVYISSAGDAAVDTFKPLCPEVVTTVTDAMVFDLQREQADPKSSWCSTVPIGQPPYREDLLSKKAVAWSHRHGLAVFTWTIDDPDLLTSLATSGVDAVYTGRADLAREIFDKAAR